MCLIEDAGQQADVIFASPQRVTVHDVSTAYKSAPHATCRQLVNTSRLVELLPLKHCHASLSSRLVRQLRVYVEFRLCHTWLKAIDASS